MSSEGTVVSTPGSALDILIKDRDEWKARALTAEAEVKRLTEENADYGQALRHMRDSEDICVNYINRARDAEARAERAETVVDLARRVAKHSRWADPDPSDLSMLRIELEAYDAARSDETKF